MKDIDLMELLAHAFTEGRTDELSVFLAEDCVYDSDYANAHVEGADRIIGRMKDVYSCLRSFERYQYKIAALEEIVTGSEVAALPDALRWESFTVLLFQYDMAQPAAVVMAAADDDGMIHRLLLSRNADWFTLQFSEDRNEPDSPLDTPATVKPLTRHDRQVKELQDAFSGQHLDDIPKEAEGQLYIWREADRFFKDWLKQHDYTLQESAIREDCIAYRCNWRGWSYTIFMYAYGQKKTAWVDGEHCAKHQKDPFAKDSVVQVTYLKVLRYWAGDKYAYSVFHFSGDESRALELWRPLSIQGKPALVYDPGKYILDALWKFMFAFNHDSTDAYECVIADSDPQILGVGETGTYWNSAFYGYLRRLHTQYGDFRLGYVRYNDTVVSAVPYLDGYGYFYISCDNRTHRITKVTAESFENQRVKEFVFAEESGIDDIFDHVPRLISAEPLPPVQTERFAVRLIFENGESRKYVLPVSRDAEEQEVLSYRNHVFTDKIWASVQAVERHPSPYAGYPEGGAAIVCKNGFAIPALRLYEESRPFSEPTICDERIYSDEKLTVRRLWQWDVNAIYEDEKTGLIKTLISGEAFNWYARSTFLSPEGRRLSSLDFDYIHNFEEGLARVFISGCGYGYVDANMHFVISPKYEDADDFHDGLARVRKNGKWLFVDRTGRETAVESAPNGEPYQEIREFYEGLCRVSTLHLRFMDLAYHSDNEDIAGIWGYIDKTGKTVIPPQYIYAEDFEDGLALVCKGEWTKDPKWDNKYNTGRYWTETELWGAIDTFGQEVIPCKFDEIKHFWDTTEAFKAHFGGWETGKWGVIDRKGNWLAEPIFEDISYEYQDGLFVFYESDSWNDPPMGIYDLREKRVLFDPQFLGVDFLENGYIRVEVMDEKLGRPVEKIIDRAGREKFRSEYTYIWTWKDPWEVHIRDDSGSRDGLITPDGKVILPCKYDAHEISCKAKRLIFRENGKEGVVSFDDRVIVPAIYQEIYGLEKPLLTVKVGDEDKKMEGLITQEGEEVIPAVYKFIQWSRDGRRLLCHRPGHCEILEVEMSK